VINKNRHRYSILSVLIGTALCLCIASSSFAAPAKRAPIKWPDTIEWQDFESGQYVSAQTRKPMLVLIYANWCTQCHALAKAMHDPAFVNLTKRFVMVLADHDNKADGVHVYTPKLTYVPRLLFMQPDGEFWTEMTSGNQRYAYFYQASSLEVLMKNMNQSLKAHGQVK
jgi:thiol:disulfide interchange protein